MTRLCGPRAIIVGLTYGKNIILGKKYNYNKINKIYKKSKKFANHFS
jgi:hypothetical protein